MSAATIAALVAASSPAERLAQLQQLRQELSAFVAGSPELGDATRRLVETDGAIPSLVACLALQETNAASVEQQEVPPSPSLSPSAIATEEDPGRRVSYELQEQAAGILHQLAMGQPWEATPDCVGVMVEAGVVEALVAVLSDFTANVIEPKAQACWALANLCGGNAAICNRMLGLSDADTVPVTSHLAVILSSSPPFMTMGTDSEELRRLCVWLASNLCRSMERSLSAGSDTDAAAVTTAAPVTHLQYTERLCHIFESILDFLVGAIMRWFAHRNSDDASSGPASPEILSKMEETTAEACWAVGYIASSCALEPDDQADDEKDATVSSGVYTTIVDRLLPLLVQTAGSPEASASTTGPPHITTRIAAISALGEIVQHVRSIHVPAMNTHVPALLRLVVACISRLHLAEEPTENGTRGDERSQEELRKLACWLVSNLINASEGVAVAVIESEGLVRNLVALATATQDDIASTTAVSAGADPPPSVERSCVHREATHAIARLAESGDAVVDSSRGTVLACLNQAGATQALLSTVECTTTMLDEYEDGPDNVASLRQEAGNRTLAVALSGLRWLLEHSIGVPETMLSVPAEGSTPLSSPLAQLMQSEVAMTRLQELSDVSEDQANVTNALLDVANAASDVLEKVGLAISAESPPEPRDENGDSGALNDASLSLVVDAGEAPSVLPSSTTSSSASAASGAADAQEVEHGEAATGASTSAPAPDVIASDESTIFQVCVPNASELPADIFLEMTEELVTNALGAPGLQQHPEGFTWPDRGWLNKAQFVNEYRAGINATGTGVVGRGLSREEADELITKLAANGLPASLHGQGAEPRATLHTVTDDDLPPRPSRQSGFSPGQSSASQPPGSSSSVAAGLFAEMRGRVWADDEAVQLEGREPDILPGSARTAFGISRQGSSLRASITRDISPGEVALASIRAADVSADVSSYAESPSRLGTDSTSTDLPTTPSGGEQKTSDGSGEEYELEAGEVGFDVEQGKAAKFKFSDRNRVANSPMGPVLLLSTPPGLGRPSMRASKRGADGRVAGDAGELSGDGDGDEASTSESGAVASDAPGKMASLSSASTSSLASHSLRWRVRVTGNSSWSLGVVSAKPPASLTGSSSDQVSGKSTAQSWAAHPGYLAQHGRVGITTTNDALMRLEGLEGKLIDVVADTRRRAVTFSVHAHSPYTIAQPIYEDLPIRLAASGYNATIFTLLPFPEDEIAHAAVEKAVQDLAEGKQVPPSIASADQGVAYEIYSDELGAIGSGPQASTPGSYSAILGDRRRGALGRPGGSYLSVGGGRQSNQRLLEGRSSRNPLPPPALVGRRIRVKWAANRHFAGKIKEFNSTTGMHTVHYDDGDVREYRMADKKWFFLPLDRITGREMNPRPGHCKPGTRYTFQPTSTHPYHSRFQPGTIVRLLSEAPVNEKTTLAPPPSSSPLVAQASASVVSALSALVQAGGDLGSDAVALAEGYAAARAEQMAQLPTPPLRVQWDVTGLETNVYYCDLELINPEPVDDASVVSKADRSRQKGRSRNRSRAASDNSLNSVNSSGEAPLSLRDMRIAQAQKIRAAARAAAKRDEQVVSLMDDGLEVLVTPENIFVGMLVYRSLKWASNSRSKYGDQGAGRCGVILGWIDSAGQSHGNIVIPRAAVSSSTGVTPVSSGNGGSPTLRTRLKAVVQWATSEDEEPKDFLQLSEVLGRIEALDKKEQSFSMEDSKETERQQECKDVEGDEDIISVLNLLNGPPVHFSGYADVYPIGHHERFFLKQRRRVPCIGGEDDDGSLNSLEAMDSGEVYDASASSSDTKGRANSALGDGKTGKSTPRKTTIRRMKSRDRSTSRDKRSSNGEEASALSQQPPIWQVKLESPGHASDSLWNPYDQEVSALLESMYQAHEIQSAAKDYEGLIGGEPKSSVSTMKIIEIRGNPYFLDVAAMTQRNAETDMVRPIRRVTSDSLPFKSVKKATDAHSVGRVKRTSKYPRKKTSDQSLVDILKAIRCNERKVVLQPDGQLEGSDDDLFGNLRSTPLSIKKASGQQEVPIDLIHLRDHDLHYAFTERLLLTSLEQPQRMAACLRLTSQDTAGVVCANPQSILARLQLPHNPQALLFSGTGCSGPPNFGQKSWSNLLRNKSSLALLSHANPRVAANSLMLAKLAATVLFEGFVVAQDAEEFKIGKRRTLNLKNKRGFLVRYLWDALDDAATPSHIISRNNDKSPESAVISASMDIDEMLPNGDAIPPDAFPPMLQRQLTAGLMAQDGLDEKSMKFLQFIVTDLLKDGITLNSPELRRRELYEGVRVVRSNITEQGNSKANSGISSSRPTFPDFLLSARRSPSQGDSAAVKETSNGNTDGTFPSTGTSSIRVGTVVDLQSGDADMRNKEDFDKDSSVTVQWDGGECETHQFCELFPVVDAVSAEVDEKSNDAPSLKPSLSSDLLGGDLSEDISTAGGDGSSSKLAEGAKRSRAEKLRLHGMLPLQMAVFKNLPIANIEYLLKHGADPDATGPMGSARDIAERMERSDVLSILPRPVDTTCFEDVITPEELNNLAIATARAFLSALPQAMLAILELSNLKHQLSLQGALSSFSPSSSSSPSTLPSTTNAHVALSSGDLDLFRRIEALLRYTLQHCPEEALEYSEPKEECNLTLARPSLHWATNGAIGEDPISGQPLLTGCALLLEHCVSSNDPERGRIGLDLASILVGRSPGQWRLLQRFGIHDVARSLVTPRELHLAEDARASALEKLALTARRVSESSEHHSLATKDADKISSKIGLVDHPSSPAPMSMDEAAVAAAATGALSPLRQKELSSSLENATDQQNGSPPASVTEALLTTSLRTIKSGREGAVLELLGGGNSSPSLTEALRSAQLLIGGGNRTDFSTLMDVLGLVENAPRVPRSASGPAEAFGRSTTGHGRGNSETSVHAPAAGKLVRLHTQWVLSQLSTEHARLVRAYESRESGADEQRNGSPLTQDSEPRAMLPDTAQPPASLAALVAALESACALESGTITHDDTNSASVFVSRTREEHLRECRETVTSHLIRILAAPSGLTAYELQSTPKLQNLLRSYFEASPANVECLVKWSSLPSDQDYVTGDNAAVVARSPLSQSALSGDVPPPPMSKAIVPESEASKASCSLAASGILSGIQSVLTLISRTHIVLSTTLHRQLPLYRRERSLRDLNAPMTLTLTQYKSEVPSHTIRATAVSPVMSLVRHILSAAVIEDKRFVAWGKRLVGCVIEVRAIDGVPNSASSSSSRGSDNSSNLDSARNDSMWRMAKVLSFAKKSCTHRVQWIDEPSSDSFFTKLSSGKEEIESSSSIESEVTLRSKDFAYSSSNVEILRLTLREHRIVEAATPAHRLGSALVGLSATAEELPSALDASSPRKNKESASPDSPPKKKGKRCDQSAEEEKGETLEQEEKNSDEDSGGLTVNKETKLLTDEVGAMMLGPDGYEIPRRDYAVVLCKPAGIPPTEYFDMVIEPLLPRLKDAILKTMASSLLLGYNNPPKASGRGGSESSGRKSSKAPSLAGIERFLWAAAGWVEAGATQFERAVKKSLLGANKGNGAKAGDDADGNSSAQVQFTLARGLTREEAAAFKDPTFDSITNGQLTATVVRFPLQISEATMNSMDTGDKEDEPSEASDAVESHYDSSCANPMWPHFPGARVFVPMRLPSNVPQSGLGGIVGSLLGGVDQIYAAAVVLRPRAPELCLNCRVIRRRPSSKASSAKHGLSTVARIHEPTCCPAGHELKNRGCTPPSNNGWACDGRNLPGGCVRGCTGYRQSDGWGRFQCEQCDWDLCDRCVERDQMQKLQERESIAAASKDMDTSGDEVLDDPSVDYSLQGTVDGIKGNRITVTWDSPPPSALSSSQDADEGTREDSSSKSPRYNASSKQKKNTSIHLADDLEVYIGMHTRVKRGSSWHYKDAQDGGVGNLGNCTGFSRKGVVRIRWDVGQPEENTYRVDRDHDEVIPQEAEDEKQHVAVVLEGVSNHPVHHYKITEVRSAVRSSRKGDGTNGTAAISSSGHDEGHNGCTLKDAFETLVARHRRRFPKRALLIGTRVSVKVSAIPHHCRRRAGRSSSSSSSSSSSANSVDGSERRSGVVVDVVNWTAARNSSSQLHSDPETQDTPSKDTALPVDKTGDHLYSVAFDDGTVATNLERDAVEGEQDGLADPTSSGEGSRSSAQSDRVLQELGNFTTVLNMEDILRRTRGSSRSGSGRDRMRTGRSGGPLGSSSGHPNSVVPLQREYSGVSTAMRNDGQDFLLGVGDTYEVEGGSGQLTQRETGDTLSLQRVRSMGRPIDDRPPRLRVLFRIVATPAVAYRHKQHQHPLAIVDEDFSAAFPMARGGLGSGWRCDGKVELPATESSTTIASSSSSSPSFQDHDDSAPPDVPVFARGGSSGSKAQAGQNYRQCEHSGNGSRDERYRCTMGDDYDLCPRCFHANKGQAVVRNSEQESWEAYCVPIVASKKSPSSSSSSQDTSVSRLTAADKIEEKASPSIPEFGGPSDDENGDDDDYIDSEYDDVAYEEDDPNDGFVELNNNVTLFQGIQELLNRRLLVDAKLKQAVTTRAASMMTTASSLQSSPNSSPTSTSAVRCQSSDTGDDTMSMLDSTISEPLDSSVLLDSPQKRAVAALLAETTTRSSFAGGSFGSLPLNAAAPWHRKYTLEFCVRAAPPLDTNASVDAAMPSNFGSAAIKSGYGAAANNSRLPASMRHAAMPSGYSLPAANYSTGSIGSTSSLGSGGMSREEPSGPLSDLVETHVDNEWGGTLRVDDNMDLDIRLRSRLCEWLSEPAAESLLLLRSLRRVFAEPVRQRLTAIAKKRLPTKAFVTLLSDANDMLGFPNVGRTTSGEGTEGEVVENVLDTSEGNDTSMSQTSKHALSARSEPPWIASLSRSKKTELWRLLSEQVRRSSASTSSSAKAGAAKDIFSSMLTAKAVLRAAKHCDFLPQTGQAFWDPLRIEQTVEWFYVRQAEGAVEMKFLQVLPAADANMTNDDRDELVEAATVGEEAAKMASVLLQVWTDESVWLNTALDSRLELQLKDAISIATQALPGWCALLTSCARFLFTPATRNRFLWCTAFGVSRAVDFLQQGDPSWCTRSLQLELDQLNDRIVRMMMTGQDPQNLQIRADQMEDQIRERRRRHHIGVLRHDYVRGVRRSMILEDAKYIAKVLASSRSALQVTFAGEDGHGDGVTRGFYVATAEAVQSRRVNSGCMQRLPANSLTFEHGATTALGSSSELMRLLRPGDSLFVIRSNMNDSNNEDVDDDEDRREESGGQGGNNQRMNIESKEDAALTKIDLSDRPSVVRYEILAINRLAAHRKTDSGTLVNDVPLPPSLSGMSRDRGSQLPVPTPLGAEFAADVHKELSSLPSDPSELIGAAQVKRIQDVIGRTTSKDAGHIASKRVPSVPPSVFLGTTPPSMGLQLKSMTSGVARSLLELQLARAEAKCQVVLSRAYEGPTASWIGHSVQSSSSSSSKTPPEVWRARLSSPTKSCLRVIAGPRLETGGRDLTGKLKPGDVVTIRLTDLESADEDDEEYDDDHESLVSLTTGQTVSGGRGRSLRVCDVNNGQGMGDSKLDDDEKTDAMNCYDDRGSGGSGGGDDNNNDGDDDGVTLAEMLARVVARLNSATRRGDRQEVRRLMRRRTELQQKVRTEQAMLVATMSNSMDELQNECNHQFPFESNQDKKDISNARALGGGGPIMDERSHAYRVVHVSKSAITVDRPVHANPEKHALRLGWPVGSAMLFVPDGGVSEAFSNAGYLSNTNGLFPAPLHPAVRSHPAACHVVLEYFHFFGLFMAKAMQDGFLVPLPFHSLFFQLVCNGASDCGAAEMSLVDCAVTLSSPQSHMVGCAGETVAKMMALIPALRAAKNATDAAVEAQRLVAVARRSRIETLSGPEADEEAQHLERLAEEMRRKRRTAGAAAAKIMDQSYAFTPGKQTLRELLECTPLEFADPITGLAIVHPKAGIVPATTTTNEEEKGLEESDANIESTYHAADIHKIPRNYSETESINQPLMNLDTDVRSPVVTSGNLLAFLEAVADLWLGSGVQCQIEAFRKGVSQVFDWRHLLAFSATELSDMMCGAGNIEWTEKSLRRLLKPSGGFSHDSPTIQFLRAELVNMQNPDRQSFLKFATAVPRLVPDTQLIVTCKGKGGSWLPTAQTCTPQLNLSVYKRQADLGAALREAMANADADGGFHERAAGSDGNDAGNELSPSMRGEASMQVDLPPLLRGAMTAQSDELDIEDEMEHDEEREEGDEEEGEEGRVGDGDDDMDGEEEQEDGVDEEEMQDDDESLMAEMARLDQQLDIERHEEHMQAMDDMEHAIMSFGHERSLLRGVGNESSADEDSEDNCDDDENEEDEEAHDGDDWEERDEDDYAEEDEQDDDAPEYFQQSTWERSDDHSSEQGDGNFEDL